MMNDLLEALVQMAQPKGYGYPRKWDGNQSPESYLSRGEDSALGVTEDSEDRVMPDVNQNDNPTADEANQEYGYNQGNKLDEMGSFQHERQCMDCKGHGCKTCGGDGKVIDNFQYKIPAD